MAKKSIIIIDENCLVDGIKLYKREKTRYYAIKQGIPSKSAISHWNGRREEDLTDTMWTGRNPMISPTMPTGYGHPKR